MEFREIKGFGEKRIALMKEAGFDSPADLLTYFPARYIDTAHLTDLNAACEGDRVVILASSAEKPKYARIRKTLGVVKAKFVYDGKTVWCSWFNQPYMVKNVIPDRYYYICGKLKKFKSTFEIVAPTLLPFDGNENRVVPVYRPIGKVSGKLVGEAVSKALERVKVEGYIPPVVAEKYGIGRVDEAVRNMHAPKRIADVTTAKRTISIEKLAYNLCAYSLVKSSAADKPFRYGDGTNELNAAISSLPYSLTPAQKSALGDIIKGMRSREKTNFLVEGDVGSGKTIVAFLAMYYAALNGYQAALMCPTEILARQHFRNALKFFTEKGVTCAFLSGSVTGAARAKTLADLESGAASLAFGTHALLGDDVIFNALSLVITDEQHRFGVAQRGKLENKSEGADTVVMSATPIPRTLALTLYGELGLVEMKGVPARKARTTTRFVPHGKEEDMWEYVRTRAENGEQTFVVAPRISGDEEDETEGATEIYEKRKKSLGNKAALLHGKMKDREKDDIMSAFARGEIAVLIATSVVEVGIDVPNATTMIVYDAERFGLSQLHQLRGRVGRGDKDSYCFILSDNDSPETRARLDYFTDNTDGFALAEYDYRVRGGGDFIGVNQHGESAYDLTPELVAAASAIKKEMLGYPSVVEKIASTITDNKYEYISRLTLN